MKYKKVVVAGGGVLGSQIAFQSAYCGFDVTILEVSEKSIPGVKNKLKNLYKFYIADLKKMKKKKVDEFWSRGLGKVETFDYENSLVRAKNAYDSIKIVCDQKESLKDADLVIESIIEDFGIKAGFYKQIAPLLPDKTVIVTNSSTLLPSKLSKFTGRPEKYLSLHFANTIWRNNIAEVMKHDKTNNKYFKEIIEFAEAINMIPLAAKAEKSGYILNSMLVPFLLSGMDLLANGISDAHTIDKAWTYGTGAPKGPFQIIDTVGLETAKNIVVQYQRVPNLLDPLLRKMMLPYNYDGMLRILNEYIKKGKLGKSTKEGFYKWDDNGNFIDE